MTVFINRGLKVKEGVLSFSRPIYFKLRYKLETVV